MAPACYIKCFLGNLGAGELVIIAFVVLLLFGGRKIPELMKGIGKGVRSFRDGMNEVTDELKKGDGDRSRDDSKK